MIARRSLLKSGAAVALGAPALSGLAQQAVTLKFHTFMSPQSNVWLTMHKPWMDRVEKESSGRIKFEGYPAMQLGGTPVQLYDQAKDGVVDVVWTLPGNTAGRFPRVEVFELPFMMNNAEATSKAYWEYFQTVAADEFKDTQVIAVQVHGPGVIHTTDKAVRSIADMRGLKVLSYDGLALLRQSAIIFNNDCKAAFDRMIPSVGGIALRRLGAILIDLAPKFGIRVIRLPFEELGFTLNLDPTHWLDKATGWWIFSQLRRRGERRLQQAGIDCAQRVYGLLKSGDMTEDYLLGLIPQIQAQCIEIYAHPAIALPNEPNNGPSGAGERELKALLSDRVRAALTTQGFTLTQYRDPQIFR